MTLSPIPVTPDTNVQLDERTIAVEHASFRLAYMCLSYGLLASVPYHPRHQTATTRK